MNTQESLREVANLRLRFQMNQRLRLESLAALSKVFREYGEPIRDELLATIVPAIPDELPGIGSTRLSASDADADVRDIGGGPPPAEGGPPPAGGGPPPASDSQRPVGGGPPPSRDAGTEDATASRGLGGSDDPAF
ncbi:MAG TPA: hypothetical protein VNA19_11410, partial [Pyrinomonadaceae bacterium]|nr:hypothetical protein [Pyrinomonadaceae bacterium]